MAYKFSTRRMLVIFAFVAMLIAIVVTQAQLSRARSQLKLLADRFGVLQVADDEQFNVVAAQQTEPHVYNWQVHLPPGRRYYLYAAHGEMSPADLPPKRGEARRIGGVGVIPTGSKDGTLISFSVKRSGEQWFTELSGGDGGSSRQFPIETFEWLDDGSDEGHRTDLKGSSGTEQYSVDKPLILLNHRRDVLTNLKAGQPEPKTDALVVWIQEFFGVAPDGSLIFEKPPEN